MVGVTMQRTVSEKALDRLEKAKGLASATGRKGLRLAIVTENFLPKVDGVTRTVARLLEHLQAEGHEALVCGPASGMQSYAGHEVVGTRGVPLLGVYNGLSLNFMRPLFVRKIREFQPDAILFIDPIWLCAQAIPAIELLFPDIPLLTSFHTNIATYATLFGFPWLTATIWSLQRNLHARCRISFCPSPSTARMLTSRGFNNVRIWARGVDIGLFNPGRRSDALRLSWAKANAPALPATTTDAPPAYSPQDPVNNKVVILYVGRISWEKNLKILVESFRGLEEPAGDGSRPACQLVFVGDGPARKELECVCESYNLNATFMGFRKGEELAAAYASADIFAFPSWTETFGQVVLEASASGLPVVGLKAEGVRDLVDHGDTGLLLDLESLIPQQNRQAQPTDADDIDPIPLMDPNSATFPIAVSMYRDLLVSLASDTARRQQMGRNAARKAEKQSWFAAMEMLVNGVRELSAEAQAAKVARAEAELDEKMPTLERPSSESLRVISREPLSEDLSTASSSGTSARLFPRLGIRSALRRTGGRLKETSMSVPGRILWRGRREVAAGDVSEDALLRQRPWFSSLERQRSEQHLVGAAEADKPGYLFFAHRFLFFVLLVLVAFLLTTSVFKDFVHEVGQKTPELATR